MIVGDGALITNLYAGSGEHGLCNSSASVSEARVTRLIGGQNDQTALLELGDSSAIEED